MAPYDIVGNIAIIKSEHLKKSEIGKLVKTLLKRPNIKTVVEKAERFKGRLRTIKVKHLAGEKQVGALYKENGCLFKVNVGKAYFSSRLSNERLEVARKVKKGDRVLVMFAGVAPYSIVIGKLSKCKEVVGIELGKIPSQYAKENIKLNKLKNVKHIQGDVKKVIPKLKGKFDVIVMPRPNLKDSFLKDALKVASKGTKIIYYGFSKDEDKKKMIDALKGESKKIKILKVKKAGDIAPYKHRYRIEIKVL
jgi:tRNA (guanine37-N1)-methyltransferase